MKYIKKLSIFNDSINKNIELYFKEGNNIIIGPKGGGKSTLLSLIYTMHRKTKIQPWIKNALSSCDLNADTAILEYSDGEKVNTKQLSATFDNSDIITQSDDIKTRINDEKSIREDKEEFQRELISQQAGMLVEIFKQYFETFQKIYDIRREDIQWWLLEKISRRDKDLFTQVINHLQHDNELLPKTNNQLVKASAKSIALLESYILINRSADDKLIKEFIKQANIVIELHKQKSFIGITNISQIIAIEETLKYLKKLINEKSDISSKIPMFKNASINFFKGLAKQIATNAAIFENIVCNTLEFNLRDSRKTKYDIELFIDKKILIQPNDESILGILSHSLHKASKDETRYSNWLYKSFENEYPIKDIDFDKHIYGILGNKVGEHIKLMAEITDGKKVDYQTMSLGTKTSFGLRKKITSHNSSYIFLDQPEDNIDSHTIYSTLIPLIHDKMKHGQIFIVTHNANFGINMETKSVTIANLGNSEEPYSQIFDITTQKLLKDVKIKDSPVALYLEGGMQSIIDRHKKLVHK